MAGACCGQKNCRRKGEYFYARNFYDIRNVNDIPEKKYWLEVNINSATPKTKKQLIKILSRYKGEHPVSIIGASAEDKRLVKKIEKLKVICWPTLLSELVAILGEQRIHVKKG